MIFYVIFLSSRFVVPKKKSNCFDLDDIFDEIIDDEEKVEETNEDIEPVNDIEIQKQHYVIGQKIDRETYIKCQQEGTRNLVEIHM